MSLGTGSVYQRKSDGKWVAAVILGGKKIVKYAKSERQARQLLRQLIGLQECGTLTMPTRTTLATWADRWLTMIEPDRRPTTMATYRYALGPMLGLLGGTRLDRLSPDVLAYAFAQIRQQGKGSRRVKQTYRVLHTCLEQATRLGVISANPLARVDPPRYEAKERPCLTADETRRLIDTCVTDGGWYGPMLLFMLSTGLRRGECTALTWADVDLTKRVVTVDKAVAFVKNRPILQGTKTRAGRRVVSLPDLAVMALEMLPRPLDLAVRIFVSGTGTTPLPSNVRMALHRVCDRAGVRRIPPHALRHTHISLLLAAGVDVLTVARRVGHARTSITLDVYGHVVRPDSSAAAAFDATIAKDEQQDRTARG